MLNQCWPEWPLCFTHTTWWLSHLWNKKELSQVFCALKEFFFCSVASKGTIRTKEFSIHMPLLTLFQSTSQVCKAPTDATPQMLALPTPLSISPVLESQERKTKVSHVLKKTSIDTDTEKLNRTPNTPFLLAWSDNGKLILWGKEEEEEEKKRITRSFYRPDAAFHFLLALLWLRHGIVRFSGLCSRMDAKGSLQHPRKGT